MSAEPLSQGTPTPLQYFAMLVQDDTSLPLFEAAASVAQDEYPDLDVQQLLGDVDQLTERVRRRLPADAPAIQRLRALNQFFFRDMGFGGNINNYYDPDNSHLNAVLRTRRGIPITLALIWLEMAQGLRLKVGGVNFPGHFMVKVHLPEGQVIIDPFNGQSLSREDLSERLEPYKRSQGLVDEFDVPVGLYLQESPARDILARLLRNLKEIYRAQEDWERLLAVQERLVTLVPDHLSEWRDRGLAHAELGHADQAVADLERYVRETDEAPDRDAIGERLQELRRVQR